MGAGLRQPFAEAPQGTHEPTVRKLVAMQTALQHQLEELQRNIAQGLLTDKGRLFHRILMMSITTFSFQWIIIWQIQQLLSSDDKWFRNMIKGKICSKEPILKNSELSKC